MKNTQRRRGWKNRHTDGLPAEECEIAILVQSIDGEVRYLCAWHPYQRSNYPDDAQPADGYLGTAEVILGKYVGIGFHAWLQNNYEFIYYKVI